MCLLALSERYHLLTSSSISSTTPPYSHPRARHLAFDSNQPRLPLHRPKDFTLAGKKRRTSRYHAAPYTSPSYVQPLPRRKLCAFLSLRQVLSRVSIPLFPQQPRLSFNVRGSESVSMCPYSILVSGLASPVSFAEWEGCSETAEKRGGLITLLCGKSALNIASEEYIAAVPLWGEVEREKEPRGVNSLH
jgi:hypothetical protein